MSRRHIIASLGLALIALPAAAGDFPLAEASTILQSDAAPLYVDADGNEVWGKLSAPAQVPRYCVKDGKITCVMYGVSKARLISGDSFSTFYGLEQLPPVTDMRITFHPQDATATEDRYDIVLLFTGYPK